MIDFDLLSNSISRLEKWIQRENFKGWDPFDALNSPIIKRIVGNNRIIGQLFVQLIKKCPINLRPFLGIPKSYNPKGMGLFLSTYTHKYQNSRSKDYLHLTEFFADWLVENKTPGTFGIGWGYNFDWPNRGFFATAGTPTIVNSCFIGLAFLDYADVLRKNNRPYDFFIKTVEEICEFILKDLNITFGDNELCFSYTPIDRRCIHNANMLGAWLLSAAYSYNQNSIYAENALKAARFTVQRIEPDGSWKYGINSNDNWVDNFHTGYVLVSLKQVSKNLHSYEFDNQIECGYQYWKKNFFLPDGTPRYYSNSTYPIDSHSISQAILTFLEFADVDQDALNWANRVADWACANMQDPEGYFYYQKHRLFTNRIPYMRWSEAWMFRALTDLQITLYRKDPSD